MTVANTNGEPGKLTNERLTGQKANWMHGKINENGGALDASSVLKAHI